MSTVARPGPGDDATSLPRAGTPSPGDATVIIVNYGTPELTRQAVASAEAAAQVVVVDNASSASGLARLPPAIDGARVVPLEQNRGFGAGANAGADAARGDVLVFLNSDATLREGALATLVHVVRAGGGRVVAGPRLLGADGAIQRSAGLVPGPADLVLRGLELQRLAAAMAGLPLASKVLSRLPIAREYRQAEDADATIDVSMVSGACLAIGREAFLELGGFDERYFMYFEDADLCRKAARAGMPIRFVPDAVVDHIGGASSSGDYRFGPWHAASMVRYLRDWHGTAGAAVGVLILWLRAVGASMLLRPGAARARAALVSGIRTVREPR